MALKLICVGCIKRSKRCNAGVLNAVEPGEMDGWMDGRIAGGHKAGTL